MKKLLIIGVFSIALVMPFIVKTDDIEEGWTEINPKKIEEEWVVARRGLPKPSMSDAAYRELGESKNANAYDILGVTETTSKEAISKHFRALALKWHPDRNKNPHAEEIFKLINWAYTEIK